MPPSLSQMCFLSGNQGLTIGILATILCLLAAGFVVYLKRKTLIRLLFTDKKTTIEKLRYPGLGSSFQEMVFERMCNGLLRTVSP